MPENVFDAIVVGSGISGGWAAKELTEKGLKVIMLERGRMVNHIKDYVNANKHPWEFPHRGRKTQEMRTNYPVLDRDYPLNEMNLDFWVNEQETLRLVQGLPFWWPQPYLGQAKLPAGRPRL